MKKWLFMKKWLMHCKNAYKVMVLVKRSYQEDPIAVIFVVVAWPEVAYGIDFYKNVQNVIFQKMSRCLIGAFWSHLGLSRSPSGPEFRDLAAGTPPGPQNPLKKFKNLKNPGFLGISSPPDSRSTAPAADMLSGPPPGYKGYKGVMFRQKVS